jgi:hypothetical protein
MPQRKPGASNQAKARQTRGEMLTSSSRMGPPFGMRRGVRTPCRRHGQHRRGAAERPTADRR